MASTTNTSIKAGAIRRAHALRREAEMDVLRAILGACAKLLRRLQAPRRIVAA